MLQKQLMKKKNQIVKTYFPLEEYHYVCSKKTRSSRHCSKIKKLYNWMKHLKKFTMGCRYYHRTSRNKQYDNQSDWYAKLEQNRKIYVVGTLANINKPFVWNCLDIFPMNIQAVCFKL